MSAMRRLSLLIVCLLALAGCEDRAPAEKAAYPLPQGLQADVEINGRSYVMSVVDVDGGLATLQFHWKQRLVAERVQYRGLFSLSGMDGDSAFVNEIDLSLIESLFPLEVGDTLRFPGVLRRPAQDRSAPFRTSLEIVGDSEVTLMGGSFDVLDIRIVTEIMHESGVRRQIRELAYSPELGLPLKMQVRNGENYAKWRILRIDMPARGRRNRLGTVMI